MKQIFFIFFLILSGIESNAQWINQSIPNSINSLFSSYFFDENTGYLGGSHTILVRTSSGGNSWKIDTINYSGLLSMDFIDNKGVISSNQQSPRKSFVLTSTNFGKTWSATEVSNNYIYSLKLIDSNTIICCSDSGKFYRSSNFGKSWVEINTGVNTTLRDVYFPSQQTGYAVGGFEGKWFKSTNGGHNWIEGGYLSSTDFYKVFFINNDTGFITGYGGIIRKTINGGFSWTAYPVGNGGEIKSIFFPSNDTGYAISNAQIGPKNYTTYFLKTTNGGSSWTSNDLGNTASFLFTMFFVNNNVGWIAGAGSRIFKTTTGGLTFISNTSTEIPDVFFLSQNYPNPFNPVTKIKFGIPEYSEVRLSVFDILGKEILVLHDGSITPGEYEYSLSANDLPSGVYFYKLKSNKYNSVKRMVVLK